MDDRPETWAPHALIGWLVHDGMRINNPRRFVDELCARLLQADVPIWRFGSYISTLHPEVFGDVYLWTREAGRAEHTMAPHAITETVDYRQSPLHEAGRTGKPFRARLTGPDARLDYPLLKDLQAKGGTDYLAMPYFFTDGSRHHFTFGTDHPDGFTEAHIALFEDMVRLLAWYAEAHAVRRVAARLLDTYVGHATGEKILAGQILRGSGATIRAALWLCDLRGFTGMSDRLPRDDLIDLLNRFFDRMAAPVLAQGGEILKFIGDAMLAIFPAGEGPGEVGDARAACTAAFDAGIEAIAGMAWLNAERAAAGHGPLDFGIALHLGDVMYGNIGASSRLDFTVIGPAVNLVDRLQGLCRSLELPLVASAEFAQECDRRLTSLGDHPLRGIDRPKEIFALPDADQGTSEV
jgi:adenylate cyclase